jgi:hypothetical protein
MNRQYDGPHCPIGREEALEWLQEGHDPFQPQRLGFHTAFHGASERRDLELLLHMAAEPDTAWTKKFLFCRNREVEVPVKGRAGIPSLTMDSYQSNFFSGRSMEGLEVLMMYGHKLNKQLDIRSVCLEVFRGTDDDPKYYLKVLKFCLATADPHIVLRRHLTDVIRAYTYYETPSPLAACTLALSYSES